MEAIPRCRGTFAYYLGNIPALSVLSVLSLSVSVCVGLLCVRPSLLHAPHVQSCFSLVENTDTAVYSSRNNPNYEANFTLMSVGACGLRPRLRTFHERCAQRRMDRPVNKVRELLCCCCCFLVVTSSTSSRTPTAAGGGAA